MLKQYCIHKVNSDGIEICAHKFAANGDKQAKKQAYLIINEIMEKGIYYVFPAGDYGNKWAFQTEKK